jgi:DNA-binding MarR family transcriptional regulator
MPRPSLRGSSKREFQLNQRFGYRFSMISKVLAQHTLLYVEREFGLNLAEYRVLTVLADRDKPSTRDIAAYTQMDRAHVTRAVADLMARGLATQIVDQGDRRLRVVDMTSAGRAIMASTLPFMVARQLRLEGCLSALELRILWKALSVLTDEARRMLAEAESRETRPSARQPVRISFGRTHKGAG